ncbi:MAG: archaellin/type IV pilin N-terminal domain-containing protein, partial [Thermoplasmata archaeon]
MKRKSFIRKDEEGVSPVIATILMVAITVVLAAVLYIMVIGLAPTGSVIPTGTWG